MILRWSRGWEINGFLFKPIGFIGPWWGRQRDNFVQGSTEKPKNQCSNNWLIRILETSVTFPLASLTLSRPFPKQSTTDLLLSTYFLDRGRTTTDWHWPRVDRERTKSGRRNKRRFNNDSIKPLNMTLLWALTNSYHVVKIDRG